MAKSRKLSTEILLVFLFLIAVSSSTIILFTYLRNNKLIRRLAEGTIYRISDVIVERVDCMLNDLATLPKSGIALYTLHPNLNLSDPFMLSFLLNGLQTHPHLYAFYIGTPDGKALLTFNLSLTSTPSLFGPHQAPKEAAYASIYVAERTETITYFTKELTKISEETTSSGRYDPRERPWYQGAQRTGKLFWTDVFLYEPTQDAGIAVALPAFNAGKQIQFIYGADLSLTLFEKFLEEQKAGTSVNAFILDKSGKIIIPHTPTSEAQELAALAYGRYKEVHRRDFAFDFQKTKYLSAVYPFPADFGKDWLILIADPVSDYFSAAFQTEHQVVWISVAILALAAFLVVYFSKHISAPIVILAHEVDKLTRLELESDRRVTSDIEEIKKMDYSIADLRSAIRSFSCYVPKEIVKELVLKGKEIALGGEKKEITILFTDIVEFTPVAETLPIETVMSLLSEYFDLLSKIILKNHGTIDKYIGDSIMAFWGAPQEREDQATLACLTALACQTALTQLNRKRGEKRLPPFLTRIGINTGHVIVGNMGTSERMNYTVIGDAVNAASRIQLLNKIYQTQILISETTRAQIGSQFLLRPIDEVELRGKKKKIKLFELMALQEEATEGQKELALLFTQAYNDHQEGHFAEARRQFQAILKKFPTDAPTQLYLEKLKF